MHVLPQPLNFSDSEKPRRMESWHFLRLGGAPACGPDSNVFGAISLVQKHISQWHLNQPRLVSGMQLARELQEEKRGVIVWTVYQLVQVVHGSLEQKLAKEIKNLVIFLQQHH